MKKIILSITILAMSLAFTGCGSDDDGGSCKTCEDEGYTAEACDNGDGTGTFKIFSEDGEELFSITDDLEEGESIDDLDCGDFDIDDFIGDIEDFEEAQEEEEEEPITGTTACATCSTGPVTSEYCDNGDGTITITTSGFSQTTTLGGLDFATFISSIEASGFSCN